LKTDRQNSYLIL